MSLHPNLIGLVCFVDICFLNVSKFTKSRLFRFSRRLQVLRLGRNPILCFRTEGIDTELSRAAVPLVHRPPDVCVTVCVCVCVWRWRGDGLTSVTACVPIDSPSRLLLPSYTFPSPVLLGSRLSSFYYVLVYNVA